MLAPHRSWPELVFHVLAHVQVTAHLPSSAYDPTYVRWAREALGPAEARPLGEDAAVLGVALGDHEALASVQLLAWLYDDAEAAQATGRRELAELSADEVTRADVLAALAEVGPPAELLRCAALLEDGLLSHGLPPLDEAKLGGALEEAARAAPRLREHRVVPLRSLRLRGRVRGRDIFVGWPCEELALQESHVAWQAAHEATVAEVGGRALGVPTLGERGVETVAVVTLAARARIQELADEHERWLHHLLGPPSTAVDAL
ncbi:MAG TPA: hypothetical protein ENK57_24215, partial [Polyangiaceae bacterium]|nr:hypothetical protein [Polyangiaceae bacterium]